jgi:gamma-glutamyl:cysteine ligase YbdK (ATP-grasp superfamily)
MGDEVSIDHYDEAEFIRFQNKLDAEMEFVRGLFTDDAFNDEQYKLGYELELCLVDENGCPVACNQQVLDAAQNHLFTYELAQFNLEINGNCFDLSPSLFDRIDQDLNALYRQVETHALECKARPGLFGVLPSVRPVHLEPETFMSNMYRYRLLNDRLMQMRGQPIQVKLHGEENLDVEREDVMLEALSTSLQIHLQIPASHAVDSYHASLWASLLMVGVAANSPLVFGKSCWSESRIGIFKQSVDTRTKDEIERAIIPRVHFAKGYINSFLQLFEDNAYYSPILPEVMDQPVEKLHHFNLHNGTIWRWVRPILGRVGKDYHLRLELRVVPSGPTLIDTMANMVFFVGLVEGLRCQSTSLTHVPYATLEADFYKAARHGLEAEVYWFDGSRGRVDEIVVNQGMALAQAGLEQLGIVDAAKWLDIITARARSGRTGADWIRKYWRRHADSAALVRQYLAYAEQDLPVHEWPQP